MNKTEIRSIEELKTFLQSSHRNWAMIILREIDLTPAAIETTLLAENLTPATAFFGCQLGSLLAAKAYTLGCLVMPDRKGYPFDAYRSSLYSASDLLRGYTRTNLDSYRNTPDWKSYVMAMDETTKLKRADLSMEDTVFLRLHDLAMEEALKRYFKPETGPAKLVVGIMGGHDSVRAEKLPASAGQSATGDAPYMRVALLAWKLARRGFTIVTGGGPGAMEAGNLGAWFASRSEAELREAIGYLERVPKLELTPATKRWNCGQWLDPAFEVIEKFPRDTNDPRTESVGIPTWFYGHEPPNPFASHIGKYFENSLREDGLLALSDHGVIYAEGSAGTVQEIFEGTCQNYYQTYGPPAPMVLLGARYWNRSADAKPESKDKPVWPLLQQLGTEKKFGDLLLLTDDVDGIVEFIVRRPARPVL